jgi:hypothetical protein
VAKVALNLKVDPEIVTRLDRIAAAMSERAGGAEISRSDAARVVLADGLAVTEERLGVAPAKEKPRPGKPAKK